MTEQLILLNWLTFRLILPFALLAACVFRFNLFTLIYGLFFLLVPLARSPNAYTIRRHTGGLIWALTTVSGVFMLAQVVFQIYLAANKPYGHQFPNCSLNENITRQVGLYRLDGASFFHVARLILPDVIIFIVSVVLAVLAFKIRQENADAPSNADVDLRPHRDARTGLIRLLAEATILIFVAAAGVIAPSLISSVYFLTFLFLGTFWACLGNAEMVFVKVVRYALLLFTAAHMAVLFLFQMDFFQDLVDKDSFPARLVGLLAVIRVDCDDPRDLHYQATPWFNFVNPGILIILYYLLASHIRQWKGYTRIKNPFTTYRLLHPNQRPVTYNAVQGTVTIEPPSPHSESSLHNYRVRMVLQYLTRVVAKQSYIISLIAMMAWSVIYHSWLTFVYLLMAIFLWLIPSSRSFCLKLSPLYTLYAEILLTAQFIFSLNVQQEFDAMKVNTYVDFKQIGFQRSPHPVFPLAVQSLFTFFFWTTLRLFMKERQVVHPEGGDVDLENVNGSVLSEQAGLDWHTHKWLDRVVQSVKIIMIKFWIVLCGAMLLVISMQGTVVIYRIVYMALLLCFVVMLQVNYRLWRKMLYIFWVAVIFYSMVVLLLIYTYQFEHFPGYWQNFTRLTPETLGDFGLETYASKGELILGLMTPTVFLILCILQLHYFHKHFLIITSKRDPMTSTAYQFPSFELQNQEANLAKPSGFAIRCLQFTYKWTNIILEFCWRLLEIHILKLCLLTILLAAVVDPSAINLIFILLVAISLMAYNGVSVVAQSSSTIAAVLVIVKMAYQLKMVKEEPFSANCSFVNSSNFNRSDNDWVGFRKVKDIAFEIRVYISIILIVTLRAIIVTRHRFFAEGIPANQQPKPGIVFPRIDVKDVDVGLVQCMQYMWNYGFYRFGLEICFVTMVINMCTRLDVFAVVYGILLLIMFMLSRQALARIWGIYVVVLGLLLPIQYLLVLGIPRGLCITYPWDQNVSTEIFTAELVQWLYLPDAFFPPKAIILIGDFFQLLFACCQWRVFNLELIYANEQYEGGSNENIIRSNKYRRIFENPVPDFMTYTKSYLDVLKVFLFNFMYWVTLAVVFVAGTSRISLICFFYLIACFYFLWHGNEFFRHPIKRLMRQWNIFLTGNVVIILVKVILQVVGCVHLPTLKTHYCWVIQLFGIACLRFKELHTISDGHHHGKDVPHTVPQAVGDSSVPGSSNDVCNASTDDAGLVLDAVVFVFLLLQKRIFSSWYFQWVVLEHKVQAALASRGAEHIRRQVAEQTRKQKKDEQRIMEKIRRKVERIRARQKKYKGEDMNIPPPEAVPLEVLGTPKDPRFEEHYMVSRSGDYYMFEGSDSDEEEDINVLAPSRPPETEDADPAEKADKTVHAQGPDPLQMLNYAVMMDNIKATVQDIRAVNEMNESERGSEFSSPQNRLSMLDIHRRRNTISSERARFPSVVSVGPTDVSTQPSHLTPVHSLSALQEQLEHHERGDVMGQAVSMPVSPQIPRSVSDTEALVLRAKLNEIPDAPPEMQFIETPGIESPTTFWEKVYHILIFSKMFIARTIDVLNTHLNLRSRDFRFVADKLVGEKRRMKRYYVQKVREFMERGSALGVQAVPEATDPVQAEEAIEGLEKVALSKPSLKYQKSELQLELPDRDEEEFQAQHNVVMRMVIALYYVLMAKSELLSYFMIILLQMTSASVLSLPLILMLFLWGTLSVPRPTRAFWISIISYTMAIVIIKYIFQFPFVPDFWGPQTGNQLDPLYAPKILGVEKQNHYASYDLALLLVVFFHRSVLKSLGLWRTAKEEEAEGRDTPVDIVEGEKKNEMEISARSIHQEASTSFNHPEIVFTPDVEDRGRIKEDDTVAEGKPAWYTRVNVRVRHFFANLLEYSERINVNVYSWLFLCDFLCFVIVVSFYWAFGPDAGSGDNIKDYFEENRIPTAFLIILIVQFCLMIIDRALYLRKNLKGKLIFQIILVLIVHVVFFFYLPKETGRSFNRSTPVQLWYFVKCAYFLLSAFQIRCGYPTRILGNFLTTSYSYLNLYLFKIFIIIPFLMELRNIMDWIWTDTSMSMAEWLKLEDIYANMFVLKCWRMAEKRYPTPRGTRYMTFWKYLIGGGILLLFILIIWFPLILFSLTNAVGTTNEPQGCTIEINLGGYQPIYRASSKQPLKRYTDTQYEEMLLDFAKPFLDKTNLQNQAEVKQAQSFIHQYGKEDVYLISLDADSSTTWAVSPPAEADIISYLSSNVNGSAQIRVFFRWTFTFKPNSKKTKTSSIVMGESSVRLDNVTIKALCDMMLHKPGDPQYLPAVIAHLHPFYVRVPSSGISSYVRVLQQREATSPEGTKNTDFRDVAALLRREGDEYANTTVTGGAKWWNIRDVIKNDTSNHTGAGHIELTAFVDKIFPQAWSVITGYGIVGLYISLVFVIGRLVRTWSSGQSYRIIYEDLPTVDKLLRLCMDIFLVRENREYRLEEDLYSRLIFLYRSPETMFKWTKNK
ncbi:hypothetical protein RvY_07704-3 [Ramazzottius varieornatus]|uniref:Uncharacterized protein n=1 Tax=Ramazzottius varieornatus TaxID=947166 RepID=A0A1D1V5T8_RAMVA|nr:hypothetical protein RvY_07704-3 [Ramazzottius varieornatus]